MKSKVAALLTLLGVLLAGSPAQATSILLDFGSTTVLPADELKSPAHAIGAVPASEITWNKIFIDTNTIYYGDNTLATGVTVDLGRSLLNSDTIDFNDNGFTVSALGGSINSGVYTNTSPVKDGIFGGAGGGNNLALGMRVNVLAAGTYTVYVHGRNTSTAAATPERFYAAHGPAATTYSFSLSDANVLLANSAPAITNGFVEGDNFGTLTLTLAAGESLFLASEGTNVVELRGFFNTVEIYVGVPILPARIGSQPGNRTVYETGTASFFAATAGTAPLNLQWRFNNTNLTESATVIGSQSNTLVLKNVSLAQAGNYSLQVSNATGQDLSSNAVLSVTPIFNTDQMTNIWNLAPGDRTYLGTGSTERGLAYNPATTNVLLVSRQPSERVIVLDAQTGAEKAALDVTGIPTSTPGVSLGLNMIGAGDDGAVYAAGLTVSASSPPYNIYRWPDDTTNSLPVTVFAGDPGAAVQPNLRWGDNFAVRGAGAATQILIAPGTGTNVALLQTSSGMDFLTEIPPTMISISGVPSAFAQLGLAFGPGTNTFWAKTANNALYLIQFDLTAKTGAVSKVFSTTLVPGALRGIGVDKTQKFLAGVSIDAPGDNVRIYDVSDLTAGPAFRDQEVFFTQNPNNSGIGGTASIAFGDKYLFALDSNNGIKAFIVDANYVPPTISFVTQPADRTVLEGANATFTALAAGNPPIFYQWRFNTTNIVSNGPNISGANSNVLTLKNLTTNSIGTYSLFASNVFATALSSNALLTVLPVMNTAQMSNIWSLLPGDRPYLFTNSTERGLAYNTTTTNLLLVSRNPSETVVVLDPATGAEKRFLDVTGIPATTPGLALGLSMIGVADDGAVYGAGLTISATSPPYNIYRWPDDSSNNAPVVVFAGDPGAAVQPNLRWGDNFAVRGSGTNIQILTAPGTGTNVALLRSTSGMDFQTEIPPLIIAVSNVPSGFAQLGLAFGPGTNTFWAKTLNNSLYLVQFDVDSAIGTVLQAYDATYVPGTLRGISANPSQKFLAGINFEINDTARIYDISDLAAGPFLRDVEVFATQNPPLTLGGTGYTAFGGRYLFALDSNNGLKAFLIDTNFIPAVTPFLIKNVAQNNGSLIFSWPAIVGRVYQVQYKDSLSSLNWSNLGGAITSTVTTLSATNSTATPDTRFYRVQGQ
ncbi:MAG TPA: immunoglobulin domain-containing protein [Methylomirabilota bacterium]|nr:immunoglobulin domain-containing protein [Methylomirabilota bacterium]